MSAHDLAHAAAYLDQYYPEAGRNRRDEANRNPRHRAAQGIHPHNLNPMVWSYPGATGLKTGLTDDAAAASSPPRQGMAGTWWQSSSTPRITRRRCGGAAELRIQRPSAAARSRRAAGPNRERLDFPDVIRLGAPERARGARLARQSHRVGHRFHRIGSATAIGALGRVPPASTRRSSCGMVTRTDTGGRECSGGWQRREDHRSACRRDGHLGPGGVRPPP